MQCPTFHPSVLVVQTRMTEEGERQYEKWRQEGCGYLPEGFKFDSQEVRCHSFVRNGSIEFLDDCTHALKGRTVPMEELP